MDALTKASRAVFAEYARVTLRPFEIIAVTIFVLLFAAATYLLMNVSSLWWLLMIIVLIYGAIGSIIWLIIHFTMDKLRPSQTSTQTRAVRNFVHQVGTMSDTIGMTKFGLLLRIIRDVMRKADRNVIEEFSSNSTKLKDSFTDVVESFK